jgi:uncharacterized protein YacL
LSVHLSLDGTHRIRYGRRFWPKKKGGERMLPYLSAFLLTLACLSAGYWIGSQIGIRADLPWAALGGTLLGLLLTGGILALDRVLRRIPLRRLLGSGLGLVVGLILARLFMGFLVPLFPDPTLAPPVFFLFSVFLGYLGLMLGGGKTDEWARFFDSRSLPFSFSRSLNRYLLDTSVIIDGRIADICKTGFVQGTLIIPQFVLQELHHIADSADSLKKTRGRRGLEVIKKIQSQPDLKVQIVDRNPAKDNVDAKLVDLALELDGTIVTNDFNLNKVAELQGVRVINLNNLANALKPAVLPGEMLSVQIIREGKTPGQGIAYLDDGTMVVVENARKYIGQNKDVMVTSVLQTGTGRMVFTEVKN